ncbi:hypothetical protein Hanom_Chr09g00764561 [Helianthus anomalus]
MTLWMSLINSSILPSMRCIIDLIQPYVLSRQQLYNTMICYTDQPEKMRTHKKKKQLQQIMQLLEHQGKNNIEY